VLNDPGPNGAILFVNFTTRLLSRDAKEEVFTAADYGRRFRDFTRSARSNPATDHTEATWDFLVVWQRGRIAKSLRALLDALAVSAKSFEPGLHLCRPGTMRWLRGS
jgi:hypothetical protein